MNFKAWELYVGIVFFLISCSNNKKYDFHSPNGKIEVNLNLNEKGEVLYSATLNKKPIISPSILGLKSSFSDFTNGLIVINKITNQINETWEPVWGQRSSIRNHFNEVTFELENIEQKKLNIQFRIFDDGIAFRYLIPGNDSIVITNEISSFSFSDDLSAWWTPQDFDSYEHLYQNSKLSSLNAVNTPITLEGDDYYISIHEAQLENYAGMTLKSTDSHTLEADLVPWKDGSKVKLQLPLRTPWRTIQIGEKLSDLVESSMILNLNEPNRIENTSWIAPMKYIGVWWEMHMGFSSWDLSNIHGARTKNVKEYIDFASKNNIKGVLVEGWNEGWETWHTDKSVFDFDKPYPDFNMEEIVSYADNKNVQLIGHHETGGNITEYESQMESAFYYYRTHNIHAIKTGYAGDIIPKGEHHHGQYMVNHYRKVLEKCAENKIMLDAHEPIKPTGLSRTFPNMMTREGARGMEWNAWSKGNSPEYTTTLPYTRLLAGPLDYTPGIFNVKFNGYDEGTRVHSTLARQLALMVVLYSPLQMAADIPSNYSDNPAFQFIKDFQTDYDQSLLLDGKIGDFTVLARKVKNTEEWFLGAITDENERVITFPLDFLDDDIAYKAEIYSDAKTTDWDKHPTEILIDSILVNSTDELKIALSPAGGSAIRFVPTSSKTLSSIDKFNSQTDQFYDNYKSVYKYGSIRKVEHKGTKVTITSSSTAENNKLEVSTLFDGELADVLDREKVWLGYQNKNLELQLEFKEATNINSFELSCLIEHISWIFAPEQVKIEYNNGEKIVNINSSIRELKGSKREKIAIYLEETISTKNLSISVSPLKDIPEWHNASGKAAWLFIDEIIIK